MMVSVYNKLKMLKIVSLVCVSSETHDLQRVFRCILDTKGRSLCQAFLAETVETENKNRCVIEATFALPEESLRTNQFSAFPKRVGPRILSLKSVDYFGTIEHY